MPVRTAGMPREEGFREQEVRGDTELGPDGGQMSQRKAGRLERKAGGPEGTRWGQSRLSKGQSRRQWGRGGDRAAMGRSFGTL